MVREILLHLKNIATELVQDLYEQEYGSMPAKIIKIGGNPKPKPVVKTKILKPTDYGFRPKKRKR